MERLDPKDGIAVVTGAGSGLGRALAVELVRAGFTVAGLGRRVEALQGTAALAGDGFNPVAADVADAKAVDAAFAAIRRGLGPVALLINNAAVYPHRDFLDETAESFMATTAINLGGVVACTRAALVDMVETGRGRILNVSTFADIAPLPAASAYSVSKGAARIFTRALIADLADRFPGIVIGDWMPGMLDTAMGVPDGLSPEDAARWGAELAQRMDPSLTGTLFERDAEILPPRGLKGRIKDLLLLRRRAPRRIETS
ncbi:SDR family oxidoreductase [Aestuariicoccus sp. MJ-SS9]|uniref:SDR family oxidoreductase n=1 Tax=Aestuariicoccus sp. MJ-SS9 TaxID=3079855 RepID=UPI002912B5BE|nr:SDR family oxidoreductase [Aestuariicoccus sp. MJ-SS9]MDU8910821.1 SDR family oxidoreductase [Aestuariicoccus sp. MJ-SS9]